MYSVRIDTWYNCRYHSVQNKTDKGHHAQHDSSAFFTFCPISSCTVTRFCWRLPPTVGAHDVAISKAGLPCVGTAVISSYQVVVPYLLQPPRLRNGRPLP